MTTTINSINVTESGFIEVRLAIRCEPIGGTPAQTKWHRTGLERGIDVAMVMEHVNAHLAELGHGQVSAESIAALSSISQDAWESMPTPLATA